MDLDQVRDALVAEGKRCESVALELACKRMYQEEQAKTSHNNIKAHIMMMMKSGCNLAGIGEPGAEIRGSIGPGGRSDANRHPEHQGPRYR